MREQTKPITWFVVLLSTLYSSLEFTYTARTSFSYPIWSFLTSPIGRFDDFYNNLVSDSGPWFPSRAGFVLFPGSVILYKLLSSSFLSDLEAFVIFNLLTYSLLAVSVMLVFRTFGVRLMVFLSYPVFNSFWRANNETLLFALFLFAIAHVQRNESRNDFFSGAILGLQMAIEANPFLLVALYPSNANRLKRFSIALSVTALSCVALFFVLSNTKPIAYVRSLRDYVGLDADLDFIHLHNHSLIAGISGWTRLINGEYPNLNSSLGAGVFLVLLPLLALTCLVYVARTPIQLSDRIIYAVCVFLLLPTHSFTYRQVWLLVPLGLILERNTKERFLAFEHFQIGLLVALMLPKTFIWIKSPLNGLGHYESTLVDPVLCLLLLTATARKHYLEKQLN